MFKKCYSLIYSTLLYVIHSWTYSWSGFFGPRCIVPVTSVLSLPCTPVETLLIRSWRDLVEMCVVVLLVVITVQNRYTYLQDLSNLSAILSLFFKYTSHHWLSILQPSNFSMYHICLLILVGMLSATALLQYGIPFLHPLKTVRPYTVSSAT